MSFAVKLSEIVDFVKLVDIEKKQTFECEELCISMTDTALCMISADGVSFPLVINEEHQELVKQLFQFNELEQSVKDDLKSWLADYFWEVQHGSVWLRIGIEDKVIHDDIDAIKYIPSALVQGKVYISDLFVYVK